MFFDSQDRLKSQKRITDLRQRLFTCRDYCVNGLHIQSTDIKFNSSLLKLEKANLPSHYHKYLVSMLWFSLIPGLNFISLLF